MYKERTKCITTTLTAALSPMHPRPHLLTMRGPAVLMATVFPRGRTLLSRAGSTRSDASDHSVAASAELVDGHGNGGASPGSASNASAKSRARRAWTRRGRVATFLDRVRRGVGEGQVRTNRSRRFHDMQTCLVNWAGR